MSIHFKEDPKITREHDDPVKIMLDKTGCTHLHYELQDCIFETKDWRKCQNEVQKLKKCMDEYQKSKS